MEWFLVILMILEIFSRVVSKIVSYRKGWETLTYDQVRLDAAEIYETTVSGVSDLANTIGARSI